MGLTVSNYKVSAQQRKTSTKRQPNIWGNIFADDISGKGLISNVHKEFIQLTPKNKLSN